LQFKREEKFTDEDFVGYDLRPSCSKKRRLSPEAEDTPEPRMSSSKRCKFSREDVGEDYGSSILGQHAAELLLELPHSAMQEFGNKDCMFGLIIQATRVCFFCQSKFLATPCTTSDQADDSFFNGSESRIKHKNLDSYFLAHMVSSYDHVVSVCPSVSRARFVTAGAI
jgi:hypothetical protein